MKEEKKYPEGSEGLYNANDLPSIALMKIQMETLKQEVFILRGEIDRLQNIIFPVIEELQDFGLKISRPRLVKPPEASQ